MVFPILTEMMDLCCGLQEAPESMAVRVVEASWSSGTVRSSLHILKSKRNMKTGLKSLWFTMVHCCRRKFVGLCRINHFCVNRQWGRFRRTKHDQTGDWLDSVLLCTFVGCLLRLQWPAFVYVCLLSGHAASDGHRIPDQGALSLFKKTQIVDTLLLFCWKNCMTGSGLIWCWN